MAASGEICWRELESVFRKNAALDGMTDVSGID